MEIRAERESDLDAVRAVNVSAFETPSEADLVDALRNQATPVVSLVAEDDETIVGHILFSPVSLSGHPELTIMVLAPMAVAPEFQRSGIGSALVRAGIEQCTRLGFAAIVVLGHPEYYPRFGFSSSSRFGIVCEYDVPEEVFMAIELRRLRIAGKSRQGEIPRCFWQLIAADQQRLLHCAEMRIRERFPMGSESGNMQPA